MNWFPVLFNGDMVRAILDGSKVQTRRPLKYHPFLGEPDSWIDRVNDADFKRIVGDYRRFCPYRVGDRLWVRETFAAPHAYDHLPPRLIPRDARIHYAASEERGGLLWRSPLFTPRWASRISLLVTSVRAERVQDITDDDAMREGFDSRDTFLRAWAGIYGNADGAAWVTDFQRVDQ